MSKKILKNKDGNIYTYERRNGLHILSLSGSDYAMGFQHGELLKDFIPKGVIPYFKKYNDIMLEHSIGKVLSKVAKHLIINNLHKRIKRKIPQNVIDHIKGLSEGSGIEITQLYESFTLADTFLFLASIAVKMGKAPTAPRFSAPTLGCTSALAQGKATIGGDMLHGRNLDFPGVGFWEKEQAIIFYNPDGAQRYVSISTAGIPLGGFTAMNESGLTLAVHQHSTLTNVNIGGTALGIAGDEVMRYAKNIADAIKILDKFESVGGFTYIIGSANENKILCYEIAGKKRAVHTLDEELFVYTNTYISKTFKNTEKYMYPAQVRSSIARMSAAKKMLDKELGEIDAQKISEVMGEKCTDTCRISESIAMLATVSSVVFNPTKNIFYVAYGEVPVSNGKYMALSLTTQSVLEGESDLDGAKSIDPIHIKSFAKLRDAYTEYFNNSNDVRARDLMAQAVEIEPKETMYHYLHGLLCLELKDYHEAINSLSDSIRIGHHHQYRVAEMHLWRARVHDILGERSLAKDDYTFALKHGLEPCRRAAKKGLRSKWQWHKPNIEFMFADIVIK